jgi:hypothetical protein
MGKAWSLLVTIDDEVRWISPMNYSELDILMNIGPSSLPKDVGKQQERCRRWWSMSIDNEVEIVSRSINAMPWWLIELVFVIAEGRILGRLSSREGQNKEDNEAEKTGWSGGNEYSGHDGSSKVYLLSPKGEYQPSLKYQPLSSKGEYWTVFVAERWRRTTRTMAPRRPCRRTAMNWSDVVKTINQWSTT